jgi:outer membrane lipoprotein carrier protein
MKVLGFIFMLIAPTIWAHPLQNYVNQLKTFEASFTQVIPEGDGFSYNTSSGKFSLQRPGNLFWQYQKPEGQTIIVERGKLWVYDSDLEQLTVRNVSEVERDIPLNWLLFEEPIEKRFTIRKVGQRGTQVFYSLEPKFVTYFQSVEVVLDNNQMTEVHMYESMDTVTKVRFSDIRENRPLSQKLFEIDVPEGTDVIGETF